jgi:hypothetical protein
MRDMAVVDDAEPLRLIDLPEPTAATREALRFAPPAAGLPPAAHRAAVLRTGAARARTGGGLDGWVLLRILACGVCMARSYSRCWGQMSLERHTARSG